MIHIRKISFCLVALATILVAQPAISSAFMMGPVHGGGPLAFHGMHPYGFGMPLTYQMDFMMGEVLPDLTGTWPDGNMWQGPDGIIHIQPEPAGPVYNYYVPQDGWVGPTGYNDAAPSVHFDETGFQATSSTGRYHGRPTFYDTGAFQDVLEWTTGMPVTVGYQPDGTIQLELPGGAERVCLGASAQAVPAEDGVPGIFMSHPGSLYSPVAFQYADGYRQDFHPAFVNSYEIMIALLHMEGISDVQMQDNGVITCVLDDGTSVHQISLDPALIFETASPQTGTGFGIDGRNGWMFRYADGASQHFRLFVDGTLR